MQHTKARVQVKDAGSQPGLFHPLHDHMAALKIVFFPSPECGKLLAPGIPSQILKVQTSKGLRTHLKKKAGGILRL